MCCLPLWTAMVSPTKSGSTVERRDHVLIGRLSLVARAFSTLATRWWSANGPFLTERAMVTSLGAVTAAYDHARSPFVLARLVTLRVLPPRAHRIALGAGAALAAAVRVIDWVHRHPAHGRADAAPALRAG